MYGADTAKRRRPGVCGGMDADLLDGLAAVWPIYFPLEPKLSVSDHKVQLAAEFFDAFSSAQGRSLLSRHIWVWKLVAVRGTVVKVSTVKPIVLQMNFQCMKCATDLPRVFCDGKFSPPVSCSPGCKSRTFIPMRSTAKLMDFQKIRIQELPSSDNREEGRVPRTVECELTEDLVDCCIPGEIVTVTGIVNVLNNYMDGGGGKPKSKSQGLYYLYLKAISVRNLKSQASPDEETRAGGIIDFENWTKRGLEFIVKFKEEHGPDVFRQLLHSFCPSIYGHELVKAGVTLALFGGVQKNSKDQNKIPVRGDIHVIVVGDPGLGKSQLLQAAAAVSPRGIYVCGNTTTNAGLTVAVVKDSMTNDYAFEAGAMVLADRGLCCIDEFDKMSAEHQALLEAMEQQCVSVAKAGLVASLPAHTSVLAAANPVGGHYDRAKTVNENLKMSAALLSRFDLVFILLDNPDEVLDKRLSDHIIALHSNDGGRFKSKGIRRAHQSNDDGGFGLNGNSLASRLRLHPEIDKGFEPLPGQLLCTYISYAREYIFPRMTKAAADILGQFYLRLRGRSFSADGTPITARQLESLVRLAEARARVDLREEVTAEDAQASFPCLASLSKQNWFSKVFLASRSPEMVAFLPNAFAALQPPWARDVVDIMKESLYEKFVDEHGFVDFSRSGGMSRQQEARKLLNALNKQAESQQKDCFSVAEIKTLADKISLQVPDIDAVIESLNNNNILIKKGPRMYQPTGSVIFAEPSIKVKMIYEVENGYACS
ncbi:hypothetical protein ACP4OV_028896 [Aristida adscensionis]